tara:strand:+ start:145 stop:1221 length:1077 start_codon:yes stop_codon:yes gene_type:complete
MISTEYKNIMTTVLASVITIIIMIKHATNGAIVDFWMIGNVIVLASVIIAETTLDYNKKMLVLIISVTWIGATLIQQLSKKITDNKKCEAWDFLYGNPMLNSFEKGKGFKDRGEASKLIFVLSYLFTVIMLMIILLSKVDSEVPILGFLNDNLKYLFVIMLPIIVVFVNEINILSPIYESGSEISMTSDELFNRLLTGNFKWGSDGGDYKSNNKYIVRTITTTVFLLVLFILFMNYSTGGSISIFTDTLGVGSSNIPVYIILFILLFFNFVIESLFLQKCSYENKESNTGKEYNKDLYCRIAKYGGIVSLLYISYVVAVLYQINGTRDKLFALLFIITLTFGFGEFMISMKDDEKTTQ